MPRGNPGISGVRAGRFRRHPLLSRDRAWCRRYRRTGGTVGRGNTRPADGPGRSGPASAGSPSCRRPGGARGRARRLEGLTLGLGPVEGSPRGVPAVGSQQGLKGGHGGGVAVSREHGSPPPAHCLQRPPGRLSWLGRVPASRSFPLAPMRGAHTGGYGRRPARSQSLASKIIRRRGARPPGGPGAARPAGPASFRSAVATRR
jgi:hypothetical protein